MDSREVVVEIWYRSHTDPEPEKEDCWSVLEDVQRAIFPVPGSVSNGI